MEPQEMKTTDNRSPTATSDRHLAWEEEKLGCSVKECKPELIQWELTINRSNSIDRD
jgi:hypothetical protein